MLLLLFCCSITSCRDSIPRREVSFVSDVALECAVGYHAAPFVDGMRAGTLPQWGGVRARLERTVGVRNRCGLRAMFCRRRFPSRHDAHADLRREAQRQSNAPGAQVGRSCRCFNARARTDARRCVSTRHTRRFACTGWSQARECRWHPSNRCTVLQGWTAVLLARGGDDHGDRVQ